MGDDGCRPDDLTRGRTGLWLWRAPLVLIVAGLVRGSLLYWLWIPAFGVMGAACAWNAARCGRVHCYVTGPLYLSAAVYLGLSAAHVLPLPPGPFLLVVFGLAVSARLAERKLGRYGSPGSADRPVGTPPSP